MRILIRLLLILYLVKLIGAQIGVLILARGGSKGVRLKNIQRVGGLSLICRAVVTAKNAGFNDVTVSTDHPYIGLEALKCNATVFHRSPVTATDFAPSIWGVQEYLERRPDLRIIILLQATSPFTRVSHLRDAIQKINMPVAVDCIFTVTRSFKLRWMYKKRKILPVNFDTAIRPRRQDWAGDLLETGAFYIARTHILQTGFFQNNNCTVVEVTQTESLEIDTYHDLEIANALINANLV